MATLNSGSGVETEREILVVDGRRYRINIEVDETVCEDRQPFLFTEALSLSSELFQKIAGRNREKLNMLEQSFAVRIKFCTDQAALSKGQAGKSSKQLLIMGNSKESVEIVKQAFKFELEQNACQNWTHFISIPLNSTKTLPSPNTTLGKAYADFTKQALHWLRQAEKRGSVFRDYSDLFYDPIKLHLTVGVLLADTPEKIDICREIMDKWHADLTAKEDNQAQPSPLPLLSVAGVELMAGTPYSANVLYANIDEAGIQRLNSIFQPLLVQLCQAGLTSQLCTKWHCTLMNTKLQFRKSGHRDPFDAHLLLDKLRNFQFGPVSLDQVHLSLFSQHPAKPSEPPLKSCTSEPETAYYAADHVIAFT